MGLYMLWNTILEIIGMYCITKKKIIPNKINSIINSQLRILINKDKRINYKSEYGIKTRLLVAETL